MTAAQSETTEKRKRADRRTVLKGAKVVFNGGKSVLVCRVRDLSAGGARLEFPPHTTLPEKFELHATATPMQRCELRWFKRNIAGVRFLGPDEQ